MRHDCCETGEPVDPDPVEPFRPPLTRKERRKLERSRAKAQRKRITDNIRRDAGEGSYDI